MENWPGRFSVFLLLASRLYVSQQGEAKWPCGAVFPISALPIETRPVFCCQRAALTPSECFVVAFTFDIDHSHESKPCFFMQRGIMKTGGREGESWDLIWRCELRGVLMMKCGREWWMHVRIKSASGSGADQTGRGLGLSLSLSLL